MTENIRRRGFATMRDGVALAWTIPSRSLVILNGETYTSPEYARLFSEVGLHEELFHGYLSSQSGLIRNQHLLEQVSNERLADLLFAYGDVPSVKRDLVRLERTWFKIFEECKPLVETRDQWLVLHLLAQKDQPELQHLGQLNVERRDGVKPQIFARLEALHQLFEEFLVPIAAARFALDVPYLIEPLPRYEPVARFFPTEEDSNRDRFNDRPTAWIEEIDTIDRFETICDVFEENADAIQRRLDQSSPSTMSVAPENRTARALKPVLRDLLQKSGAVPIPRRTLGDLPILDRSTAFMRLYDHLMKDQVRQQFSRMASQLEITYPDIDGRALGRMMTHAFKLHRNFAGVRVNGLDQPAVFLNNILRFDHPGDMRWFNKWYEFVLYRDLANQLLDQSNSGVSSEFTCPFCEAVVLPELRNCICDPLIDSLTSVAGDFVCAPVS